MPAIPADTLNTKDENEIYDHFRSALLAIPKTQSNISCYYFEKCLGLCFLSFAYNYNCEGTQTTASLPASPGFLETRLEYQVIVWKDDTGQVFNAFIASPNATVVVAAYFGSLVAADEYVTFNMSLRFYMVGKW